MIRVPYREISETLTKILVKRGMSDESSETCAQTITGNTCDGILSHGLARFPRMIEQIDKNEINIHAEPKVFFQQGAIEKWNGDSGPGITNAFKAVDRSIELAEKLGIGLVTMRNTTHWLRPGAYGWYAADRGNALICWTNTTQNLPPWGSKTPLIGNNPMVIAIPRAGGHFVLDMAMSQYSYGALGEYKRKNEKLPAIGGWDNQGNLTDDPEEILSSGRLLPMGFWKGSALSIVLDLLGSALAEGDSSAEISPKESNLSQVFISINMKGSLGNKATEIGNQIEELLKDQSNSRYPGQSVLKHRKLNMNDGIPIPEALWDDIRLL